MFLLLKEMAERNSSKVAEFKILTKNETLNSSENIWIQDKNIWIQDKNIWIQNEPSLSTSFN